MEFETIVGALLGTDPRGQRWRFGTLVGTLRLLTRSSEGLMVSALLGPNSQSPEPLGVYPSSTVGTPSQSPGSG